MPTQLRKAASWLMALTAFGYLLAYLRDAGVAALFGASRSTDAFFAGTFPSMVLYSVVITGSFVPALLPVFAQEKVEDERRGILVTVGRWLALGIAALVIMGELSAQAIISVLAPGFSGPTLEAATLYLRLSLPMLLFLGPAALAGAVLNYRHNFVVPAIGSVAFGGAMLASLPLALSRGLWVMALSMVAGALLQLAIQLWALPASYRRAVLLLDDGRWVLSLRRLDDGRIGSLNRHSAALSVRHLAAPMLAYVSLTQALPLLERLLASSLPGGVLSQIAYATKLYTLPVTVVATSFATVLFPGLTRHAANADVQGLATAIRRGLAQLALLVSPIVGFLWIAAPLVVALVYGHGNFTEADSIATAQLLSIYAFALLPLSISVLLTRAFYSLQVTSPPLLAGASAIVLYIALGLPLVKTWGAQGLALAMVLATWGCMFVMLIALLKRVGVMLTGDQGLGDQRSGDQGSGIRGRLISVRSLVADPEFLTHRKSEITNET